MVEKISRDGMIQIITKELKNREVVNNFKTLLEIRRKMSGKYGCILFVEVDLFEAMKSLQIDEMAFITLRTVEVFRKSLLEGTKNIVIPKNFWEIPQYSYFRSFLEEHYVFFEFIVILLKDTKQLTTINKLLEFFYQKNSWPNRDIKVEYENLSDLQRIINTYRILSEKGVRINSSINFAKSWLENEIYQSISSLLLEKITKIPHIPYAVIQETYPIFVQEINNLSFLNPNFAAISFFEDRDRFAESLTREIISSLEGSEIEMKEIRSMIIQKIQDEFGPFLFEEELGQRMDCLAIRIPAILEGKMKNQPTESKNSSLCRYLSYIFDKEEFKKNINSETLESLKIAITRRYNIYETELRQIMIINLYMQIFEEDVIPIKNLFHAAFFSFADAAYYLIFSSELDVKSKKDIFYYMNFHYKIQDDFKRNLQILNQAIKKGISPIYFYLLELEIMNKTKNHQLFDKRSVWELLDSSRKNILVIMDNLSLLDIQNQIQHEMKLLQSFIPTITPTCCSGILFDLDRKSYIASKHFFYPLGEKKFEIIKPLTPKNILEVDQFLKMSDIQEYLENLHIHTRKFQDPVLFNYYQENIASEHELSILTLFFSAFGKSIFDDKTINRSFEGAMERFMLSENKLLLVYFPEDNEKIDHLEFKEFSNIDLRRHHELVTQEKIMRILNMLKDYDLKDFRVIITTDHGSVPLLYRSDTEFIQKTKKIFRKAFSEINIQFKELSSSQIIDFNEIDVVYTFGERGIFIYSPNFQILERLDSLLEPHADREFYTKTTAFRMRDILSLERKTLKENPINGIHMLFYPTKDWICLREKIVMRTHGGASLFEIVIPGVILNGNL